MFAESLEIAEGSVKSLTRKKGRGWCRGHSARLETRPPLKKKITYCFYKEKSTTALAILSSSQKNVAGKLQNSQKVTLISIHSPFSRLTLYRS